MKRMLTKSRRFLPVYEMSLPGVVNIVAIFLLALMLAAHPASAGVKESWYMMRGNSNMKIQNYKAAIEAYEKVCDMNPDNREAMRSLGIAYDAQGLTDKAIQQYCRYLDRFGDDAQIAYKTGDLLQWARYNYRRDDAIKYYRMGLAIKYSRKYHHKIAKLLAADKSTIDEAVKEYRALMSRFPDDQKYRREYRALLLWDEKYLGNAIAEYKTLAKNNPQNAEINREYAQLLARDKSRRSEAQDQYEVLLAMNPNDRAVRLEYAKVLAADPGKFDESRKEFETVLAAGGGSKARESYADLLAGRASTRDEAAQQYRKVLDAEPGNSGARLKYAAILGGNKATLPQAIEQYAVVVKQKPNSAEAHKGLADAYAWKGDREKAIYHAQIAAKFGSTEAHDLSRKLMRGQEPYAGGDLTLTIQPGDWYGVTGFSLLGRGRINPVLAKGSRSTLPGVMLLLLDLGGENYSAGTKYLKTASGFVIKAAMDYRFAPTKSFFSRIGYHTLSHVGDGFETLLQYTLNVDSLSIRAGFRRDLVYESVFALAGHRDSAQTPLGAARASRFFGELYAKYRFIEGNIGANLGWVSVQTAGANPLMSISAEPLLGIPLADVNRNLCLSYYFEARHYDKDFSGFEISKNDTMPEPGGYFSPQAFINHGPRLGYRDRRETSQEVLIAAGPSFQYTRDLKSEKNGAGLFLQCRYFRMFNNNICWEATFDYGKGPKYSNFRIYSFVYRTF